VGTATWPPSTSTLISDEDGALLVDCLITEQDARHRRAVGDVIPDEEAIPAPFLRPGREAGRDPRISQLPEQPDIDRALHDGDLNGRPGT
jgi:hypothetical protein